MNRFQTASAIAVALVSTLLSGCSDADSKPATQVAAKVNKEEISVHQINSVLARTPNVGPEQVKEVGRQALERLIDQELLVQQAIEARLDREPRVVQSIEAARREILSRSFLDKIAMSIPKPSESDIKAYYDANPQLFAERRIYNFNEIVVQTDPEALMPKLQERLSRAKSLAEVGDWLKAQKLPLAANNATKAAEQLPMELLPRFHQMKKGQIGVIPARDKVVLVQLADLREEPMSAEDATPFIQQFLFNQRRVEAVDREMKSLREKAAIEYVGEFGKLASGEAKVVGPEEKAKAVSEAAGRSTSTGAVIDKGISGLK
jgi:EpsD family peptidyl-prolyl cis-trans isomerase